MEHQWGNPFDSSYNKEYDLSYRKPTHIDHMTYINGNLTAK